MSHPRSSVATRRTSSHPRQTPRPFALPSRCSRRQFHLSIGPLGTEIDALIGDLEAAAAKRTFAYFHVPHVAIEDTTPHLAANDYFRPRYDGSSPSPFAVWTRDIAGASARLAAIDAALTIPGPDGLMALLALKGDTSTTPSSLSASTATSPPKRS